MMSSSEQSRRKELLPRSVMAQKEQIRHYIQYLPSSMRQGLCLVFQCSYITANDISSRILRMPPHRYILVDAATSLPAFPQIRGFA